MRESGTFETREDGRRKHMRNLTHSRPDFFDPIEVYLNHIRNSRIDINLRTPLLLPSMTGMEIALIRYTIIEDLYDSSPKPLQYLREPGIDLYHSLDDMAEDS